MAQRRLDFARGVQLRTLRELTPRLVSQFGSTLYTRTGLGVDTGLAVSMLKLIDDHAGKLGWCTAKVETLALEIGKHRRTVQKVLDVLDSHGWLVQRVERVSTAKNGTTLTSRRVCWGNVLPEEEQAEIEKGGEAGEVEDCEGCAEGDEGQISSLDDVPGGGQIPPVSGGQIPLEAGSRQGGVARRQGGVNPRQGGVTPFPTIKRSATQAPSPVDQAWQAVHRWLAELGADFPGNSLDRARQAGVSVAEVRARVELWVAEGESAGWGVRALVYSIRESVPGLPPEKGWPPRAKKPKGSGSPRVRAEQSWQEQEQVGKAAEARRVEELWGGAVDRLAGTPEGIERLMQVADAESSYLGKWARQRAAIGGEPWKAAPMRPCLLRAAAEGRLKFGSGDESEPPT